MKKKLLIVNNNMHMGGVQRALVNLLGCIHDQYDVTLLLFHPAGVLREEIPADVRVVPVRSAYRFLGMTKDDVQGKRALWLQRSFYAAISRLGGRSAAIGLMALGQRKLRGYDVAISYLHDAGDKMFYGGCNDFVLRHVEAEKKVAFLHCDFLHCGAHTPANAARYARFDCVAACSEGCRDAFVQACPELKDKVLVVRNCQAYEAVRRAAESAPEQLPAGRINLLTVARMGREKGVTRAIQALAGLKDVRTEYHYYIIGDGAERPAVEELIARHGLQERVTLLGERTNPYGFMKAADVLLIPSVSEAAPMVIDEAASLGTPVLTTETTSAREMVEKKGFGWVCENSIEGIESALQRLLEQPEEMVSVQASMRQQDFHNQTAVRQFARLMGDA